MQKFTKMLFKIGVFALVISSLFCVKVSALSYNDYAVLVNENQGSIGFAGLGYTLSDDKKTLTLNFQVTDNHSYTGKNGINVTVNYGDKSGRIKLSDDRAVCDESLPCEVKASSFKTKSFSDHTNVYAELKLYFSKPVSEKLWIKVVFTDSDGNSTGNVSFEFPFETCYSGTALSDDSKKRETEKTSKTEKSTKAEAAEKQTEKKTGIIESSNSSRYFGGYSATEENISISQPLSSSDALSEKVDISPEENETVSYSKGKVTAIITASVLLSAGAVCAVLALRKGKGKD